MSEIYSKSSDNSKEMDKNKLSIFNDDNIKNREDYKDLKWEYNYVWDIIKKQTWNNLKWLSEEIDILNLSSKDLLDKFIDSDFESSNWITQEDKKQYLLFLSDIIKDALNWDLNLINIKNIDIDWNKKLSLFELKQIKSQIQTNFIDIKKMGSYESFLDVYKDIDDDINWLSITDNIDNLLWWKTISESLVNNIWDISKQDADKLLSSKWWDDDFWKWILFAISREVPQMAEDILIFLADLPGALLSLPQYLYYNFRDWYAYDMKVRSMEQKHPVLWLVWLFKNWWEVLTKLASELWSPSNWTAWWIVLSITAIVWLLAWWAWAVKLASKAGKLWKVWKWLERLDRTINFSEHAAINSVWKIAFNAPKIHEINNIPTKELITIDDNWLLKFYSNDHFRDIDGIEFEKLLIEKIDEFESINWTKVKKIDISEFNNIEHKYLKEKIYTIVWNNFPLLEVSRLTEWSKVVDITFLWIKTLNDNISKEFVDLFNNSLKSYLHKNFYKNSWINPHWRIVRDNYKHMTFSMNSSNDISNTIFWNIKNKTKLLEFIFDNLDKNKLNLALREAKVKDLESVKNILLNEFDFWIWTTIVKKSNNWNEISLSDKLESFYKAEISSRNKVDLSNLWDNLEFNFENIISFAKEALNQEKDIINKYNWKKFIFNSTEFDVIVNWKINSILLRYVRKWEDIWDKDLKLLVGNYINSLNDWFDFIAPFVEKTQLEDIWKIETQIERWIIDIDLLKNTYKNTLSVNALKLESKWKEWLRVFIDIVDMWIMNLNDFRKLASRIVSWDLKKRRFIWFIICMTNSY